MKRDLQIVKALIKEMYEGSTCNECGGAMYEGECVECGHIEEGKLTYTDEYDDNPKLKGKQKRNLPDQLQKAIINKEVETPNPPTDYEGKPAIPGLGPIVDQLQKAIINKEDDSNEPENWKIWQQKMDQGYAQGYEDGWRDGSQGKPKDNPKKSSLSGIGSIIREDHEGQDHEVSMANNSLDSILWAANELKKYLGDQERDIPAWIQDHITNAENYIIQAAKNFHEYGAEEAPEDGLGLTNEDLMSTLGGERPYSDSEMRKNIVEPNLGPDYDAYIMFQGPKGQYDQAKQKYVPKDMIGWEPLYRSSSYQGNAYISPDKNVIKAAVLSRGGIVGAIYVKKQNEMSLQEMIKKVGSKYNVYSKKGKKLGSHPSKKKAQKQMAAIEISKQGK